jgi:hypothetical protein
LAAKRVCGPGPVYLRQSRQQGLPVTAVFSLQPTTTTVRRHEDGPFVLSDKALHLASCKPTDSGRQPSSSRVSLSHALRRSIHCHLLTACPAGPDEEGSQGPRPCFNLLTSRRPLRSTDSVTMLHSQLRPDARSSSHHVRPWRCSSVIIGMHCLTA